MRVLLYDIESSPNLSWIWGKYEQNALGDFVKERQVISIAWKWLGEKETHVLALPSFRGYKKDPENNRELILRIHELFSRADVVVGHNVDQFDDKMVNAEFVVHNLKPPPPHKSVDTLKVARRYFRFNSNKLNDLGKRLKLGEKHETGGFSLWVGCMRGDPKSWATMMLYNQKDVVLLEKIYLRLRPWMTNHPDVNALDNHIGCPLCKGVNMSRRGWSISGGGRRRRYQCRDCGKWAKGAKVKKEDRYRV